MHREGLARIAQSSRDVTLSHPGTCPLYDPEYCLAGPQRGPGERGDLVSAVAGAQAVTGMHQDSRNVGRLRSTDTTQSINDRCGRPGRAIKISGLRRREVLPANDSNLSPGSEPHTSENLIEIWRRFPWLAHETESLEELDLKRQPGDDGMDDSLVPNEQHAPVAGSQQEE